MNRLHPGTFLARALTLGSLALLSACGGGGGDGVSALGGVIGGTGLKGPVASATVAAYAISGGTMAARIGTATTDAGGNFSVPIGSYAGPVMLQLSGGSYTDEATGTTMSMSSGDVMTAVLPAVAAGASISGVQVTPLTSMAQTMAMHLSGGMTDANIASANTAIGNYFMVSDILHVHPMNPLVAGSGSGASQDAINYGMTLAAMTQYAKGQAMIASSAIITAMMNDASDSKMDGMMGGSAVMMGGMGAGMGSQMPASAGTSGLASAMSTFTASSQNKSGVTASTMQTLITRLDTSNGQLTGSAGAPIVKSTIDGTVFNGATQKVNVTAFAITDGTLGAQIASTTTDGQGNFTMSMGAYSGPVMLRASGGTYTDEATGTMMGMGPGDAMTTMMTTIGSGANVHGVMVTPLTSMAQARAMAMTGGMSDANIAAANSAMGAYFMVSDIVHVQPMDPMLAGSGTAATQDAAVYGMTIAAMSEYAMAIGMTDSSSIVTAMMSDAADGHMDGMTGTTSVHIGGGMMGAGMMAPDAARSGLADAMLAFMQSAQNRSGVRVQAMQAVMERLHSSNGTIQ
jgi:hypothetical protein